VTKRLNTVRKGSQARSHLLRAAARARAGGSPPRRWISRLTLVLICSRSLRSEGAPAGAYFTQIASAIEAATATTPALTSQRPVRR
jgi:hypothetical protein